jgi:hypothetical protein
VLRLFSLTVSPAGARLLFFADLNNWTRDSATPATLPLAVDHFASQGSFPDPVPGTFSDYLLGNAYDPNVDVADHWATLGIRGITGGAPLQMTFAGDDAGANRPQLVLTTTSCP